MSVKFYDLVLNKATPELFLILEQ